MWRCHHSSVFYSTVKYLNTYCITNQSVYCKRCVEYWPNNGHAPLTFNWLNTSSFGWIDSARFKIRRLIGCPFCQSKDRCQWRWMSNQSLSFCSLISLEVQPKPLNSLNLSPSLVPMNKQTSFNLNHVWYNGPLSELLPPVELSMHCIYLIVYIRFYREKNITLLKQRISLDRKQLCHV